MLGAGASMCAIFDLALVIQSPSLRSGLKKLAAKEEAQRGDGTRIVIPTSAYALNVLDRSGRVRTQHRPHRPAGVDDGRLAEEGLANPPPPYGSNIPELPPPYEPATPEAAHMRPGSGSGSRPAKRAPEQPQEIENTRLNPLEKMEFLAATA